MVVCALRIRLVRLHQLWWPKLGICSLGKDDDDPVSLQESQLGDIPRKKNLEVRRCGFQQGKLESSDTAKYSICLVYTKTKL